MNELKPKYLAKKLLLGFIIMTFLQNLFAKEEIIAKIPEASGIDYSYKSNTLFVVNDEGKIYEISPSGKILRKKKLGDLDLEGVVIDDNRNLLLLAVEGEDDILVLSKNNFEKRKKISIKRSYKGIKILKKGNDGIEGLALHKNKIYISNQSNKKYPKEDSSVIIITDYNLDSKKLKIKDIINHGYKDIAGLTFYNGFLYMISDTESLLIKYDIKKRKTKKEYKLNKKFAQEGITFDKNGVLYIADDNGQILKIKELKK